MRNNQFKAANTSFPQTFFVAWLSSFGAIKAHFPFKLLFLLFSHFLALIIVTSFLLLLHLHLDDGATAANFTKLKRKKNELGKSLNHYRYRGQLRYKSTFPFSCLSEKE